MSPTKTAVPYNVSNLMRGLDLIELLSEHPQGLSISNISQTLSIPINAAFRIASALADRGYLLRNHQTKMFTLSPQLVRLGYRAGDRNGLVETAMPLMRELRDEIGETVILCIMAGDHCLALDGIPGLHPFRFTVDPGTSAMLHASAPGKVFLAFFPELERKSLLGQIKLHRYNERTITTRDALLEELAHVRTLGYALDIAEQHEGVHCAAAPILDLRGFPVAALTTTGPVDRLTKANLKLVGEKIVKCARLISDRIGFVSDRDLLANETPA